MVDELKLLKGSPVFVDGIGVYPLTIGEIADIGDETYFKSLNLINLTKEQVGIDLENVSDFDIICSFCSQDIQDGQESFKEIFLKSLKLFLREEVTFIKNNAFAFFIVGDMTDRKMISNNNYAQIVEVIKYQNCLIKKDTENDFNPVDEKTRELLEKRERARQLLAKAKKSGDEDSPLTLADLVSILIANGNGITPSNVWDMNFYLFNNQFNRMRMLEEYDINIRSLLAGAKSEEVNLKHWMSKIE